MPKVSLNTIGSRYGSIDALNDNFDAIEAAIENTLSLDGTSPNAMMADLDLNSNSVLNAGAIYTSGLFINGTPVSPSSVVAATTFSTFFFIATSGQTTFSVAPNVPASSSIKVKVNGLEYTPSDILVSGSSVILPACASGDEVIIDVFIGEVTPAATSAVFQHTATSGQTTFSTSYTSLTANSVDVYVDGFLLPPSEVSLSGGSVIVPALAAGQEVVIRVFTRNVGASPTANEVTFINAGSGASTRTVENKLRDILNVKDYGATGDGTTNDYTAIANTIVAASTAGGGIVYFPSGTYRTNSSITLPSNVYLSGYGATISWGGGASPVITTATTGYTSNAGIEGLTINGSTTATKLLELYSTYHCSFRQLTLTSTSTTNICVDVLCNTTGTTNPDGNRNNVFNVFDNLLQEGTCGTAIRMKGNGLSTGVVVLNTFVNFNCRGGAAVRGIDFAEWVDSNYFSGVTRINLPVTATGAVGVEWNSVAPTTNNGVYANNFDHLAVDTFGAGTGRVGVKMNLTKLNKLGFFFNEPVAEGGAIVTTANTYGYDIVHAIGGTNNTAHKVQAQNYAAGGSYSDSFSIYTNAFTLTGTNQAGVVVADTFNSAATGTGAGITLQNQTVASAFTMSAYYGVNVSNLTKGAGSTVTVQAGVYIADLTAGTTNYAIQSVVTPGTNKWGLFLSGGARNFLGAGGVEVAAGATSMTSGFVHVPSAAGVPTGAPTNPSGNVPLYYDSTNNRLYVYNGSWRSVALA